MNASKSWIVLPILILLSFFCLNPAHAIPTASLELTTTDIFVGNPFDINVVADGIDLSLGGDLLAFGFDLDFDGSQFDLNGATVAPPFVDDSLLFPNTDVAGSTFLPIGGDDILLASLNFTPLLFGNFTIGIISQILDPNEGLILLSSLINVDITQSIDIPTAVPEPGTVLLLGIGLVGLAGLRRKIRKN